MGEVPEGKAEGKKVIAKIPGGLVGSEGLRPLRDEGRAGARRKREEPVG
jgi:hypothetical protein